MLLMEPILLSHGAVSSGFYLHCCCSNVIARIAMPTFVRFKMLVTELDFETYFPQTSENVSSCELDILRNSKDIAMLICCIHVLLSANIRNLRLLKTMLHRVQIQ